MEYYTKYKKCLGPHSPSETPQAVIRGLCRSCYQAANLVVKEGSITWEELERKGKALPPRTTCRNLKSWFIAEDTPRIDV